MLFCVTKSGFAYLWLFVYVNLGYAQDVSNTSQTQVHVLPRGSISTITTTPTSATLPSYIRLRRATSNKMIASCLAPPQPANGEYKYFCKDDFADCNVSEGTVLEPGTQLIYRCNYGYKANGNTDVYCRVRGDWTSIPECIEVRCDSLNSVSTTVSCTRNGQWVNCDSPVLPETRAEVICRHGYKKDTDFVTTRRGVVICNAKGRWDPDPIRCIPVCGLAITNQQPLVFGGNKANIGEFPWHASLFVQRNSPTGYRKVFLCGATIIQINLVLTAAHCVYDERTRTTTDPTKLFVLTGNVFRDYDSPLHSTEIVRKAAVKNVHTFCNYYGLTGNYASDIALLELQQPFEFSSILLPACLDDSGYGEQFLEPGAYGRVAGFGRTATGESSAILKTLTVPYISYSQCKISNNAARNEAFISSDKFCAGYNNGSAVCDGDSGGGLVFKKGDLWYVMGVVSVGLGVDIDNGEKTCDRYSYSLFTKVSTYMLWIQDVMLYLERNKQYPSCSHHSRPSTTTSTTTSTTPKPTATPRPVTIPSYTVATNWWDKLTTAAPDVVISNGEERESFCLAPPQPANGKRKLHQDYCGGNTDCSILEGTALVQGSQLVYSCDPGFKAEGSIDVYCRSTGSLTPIPTCNVETCECVPYYLCKNYDSLTHDDMGVIDLRLKFESTCSGFLEVCCPKSAIHRPIHGIVSVSTK